ncbi:hypothetical protein K8I61_02860 [bacterium]|nr:hypothetical protein [bacterium]
MTAMNRLILAMFVVAILTASILACGDDDDDDDEDDQPDADDDAVDDDADDGDDDAADDDDPPSAAEQATQECLDFFQGCGMTADGASVECDWIRSWEEKWDACVEAAITDLIDCRVAAGCDNKEAQDLCTGDWISASLECTSA